jgi:hypothetical protein
VALGRTTFVIHKGKKICFLDFHDIHDPAMAIEAIEEARQVVRGQPQGTVLTLTYVKDSSFNREIVAQLKELAAGNTPYVKAGAVVGLSGIQRAIYVAVTQLTGRRLPTFHDLDQAKDYLADQ